MIIWNAEKFSGDIFISDGHIYDYLIYSIPFIICS